MLGPTAVHGAVTIRVAAIEDNARYRASLETLLQVSPGFSLAGSFASAEVALDELDAVSRRRSPPWDVVLMDLELPGMGGIEATRRLKQLAPGTSVVILTVFEEPATVLQAICAGADGYLLKRTPPDQLLEQLRAVRDGDAPLSAGVARTVLALVRGSPGRAGSEESAPTRLDLTEREQDVLRCLVQGMSYKQAADRLDISLDTLRTHVRAVYRKLHVHSVAEAVSRAIRDGLT